MSRKNKKYWMDRFDSDMENSFKTFKRFPDGAIFLCDFDGQIALTIINVSEADIQKMAINLLSRAMVGPIAQLIDAIGGKDE